MFDERYELVVGDNIALKIECDRYGLSSLHAGCAPNALVVLLENGYVGEPSL